MVDKLRQWLIRREKLVYGLLLVVTAFYTVTHQAIRFYLFAPFFLVLALIYMFLVGKLKMDMPILLCEIGLGLYCIFSHQFLVQFLTEPILLYVLAKLIFQYYKNETKKIKMVLIILVGGLFARALCNWGWLFESCEIGITNLMDAFGEGRETLTEWVGFIDGKMNPRTVYEFHLLPVASLFFVITYLVYRKRKIPTFGVLLCIIVANLLSFISIGRMTACVTALSFVFISILAAVFKRELLRHAFYISIVGAIGVILVIGILGVAFNWFELADKLWFWNRDGGILRNCRFEMDVQQIELLFKYPFGGCAEGLYDSGKDMYYDVVHNFWLQIGREAGIIPFICVFASNVWIFIDSICIWKNRKSDEFIIILLSSVYFAFMMYYMIEVAPMYNFEFYAVSFFVGGMIRECYLQGREDRRIERQERECHT